MRDGKVIKPGPGPEIVPNPANEYISKFVQEANRGRAILVKTIMQPLESPVDAKGPSIDENS